MKRRMVALIYCVTLSAAAEDPAKKPEALQATAEAKPELAELERTEMLEGMRACIGSCSSN